MEGDEEGEGDLGTHIVSNPGLGWEAGGGVLISVGRRTSLSPGLRYGWGRVPFSGRGDMTLQYLILDLGVVLGF